MDETDLREHEEHLAIRMQRGGLRNIKVKPPTFNGKQGENVKNFFSKLEKYLEVQQVAEDEKVEAAGLCFESMNWSIVTRYCAQTKT